MADVFAAIVEDRRAAALVAIASVADPASVTRITPTTGGASGASTLRVDADSGSYLLRLEPGRKGFQDPYRSYPCLRVAAAAGLSPAVHHADDEAGVALMDFVVERPLTAFPGGGPALLRTLGEMVARLQATAPFPRMMKDFGALVEAMLHLVRDGGLFAPGVLDGHVAGLARIRAEYPWTAVQVSAHNDINPRNVLFDGERLWLVDWELAFRNDPLADVANIANSFPDVADAETLVLEGWLGRSPDDDTRHRLTLMRDLQRLFSGCLMLSGFIGQREPEAELTAPAPDELRAAIGRGELRGTPELVLVVGKMHLAGFTAARRGGAGQRGDRRPLRFGAVSLTALDRIEIFELPARYADALDRLEPERLRGVFTDDAVWEMVDGLRLVGIDEIMEFMGRPDVHPGAHLMTNIYIDSVDEDAGDGPVVHLRSRGVFPVGPSDPRNPTTVFYGRYDDAVVGTASGWRIRHRRFQFGS